MQRAAIPVANPSFVMVLADGSVFAVNIVVLP
jgi:hypothetical protein